MEHTQDAERQVELLIDSLCNYYNHDAKATEVSREHSNFYMRDESVYWDRIMHYLPLVFLAIEQG